MTRHTHTPGPWIVQADPEHEGKHPLHDNRFVTTADLDMGPDAGPAQCTPGSIICSLRDQARQAEDAALISAAPDLLTAAKQALALIDDMARFAGGMALKDYAALNEAPLALRAAIRKAKHQPPGEAMNHAERLSLQGQ